MEQSGHNIGFVLDGKRRENGREGEKSRKKGRKDERRVRSHFYKTTIKEVLPHIQHTGDHISGIKTSIQNISHTKNEFPTGQIYNFSIFRVGHFLYRYSIFSTLKNLFCHISCNNTSYLLRKIICSVIFPALSKRIPQAFKTYITEY